MCQFLSNLKLKVNVERSNPFRREGSDHEILSSYFSCYRSAVRGRFEKHARDLNLWLLDVLFIAGRLLGIVVADKTASGLKCGSLVDKSNTFRSLEAVAFLFTVLSKLPKQLPLLTSQ